METILKLDNLLKSSLCTFEVAKKASSAGLTCANTFFAYDETGEITDSAWLEKVAGIKMFPAVNLPFAIIMLEHTTIDMKQAVLTTREDRYFFKWAGDIIEAGNLVDVLVMAWVKYKKD